VLLEPGGPFGERPPDLILLDLVMPVMDGAAFAARYRARPGPHAPLVAFTAVRDTGVPAHQIEVDGVLRKPFRIEELLETAAQFAAPPASPPGPPSRPAPPAQPADGGV
jgi:CheY-like chemotaxis protein